MELWIPITLLAAASQTIRTAIQRQMKGALGDYGASAIRFIYAVPFAWLWFVVVMVNSGESFLLPGSSFFLWAAVGGLAQILFTVFLVKLFSYKNFLVGVAFSKTEVLIAALLEAAIFSAAIGLQFGVAILLGICAVVLLSFKGSSISLESLMLSLRSVSTFVGLLCGSTLAISVIGFRIAINNLPEADFLVRATTAAAIAVLGQAIGMIIYLFIYRRPELIAVFRLWKVGIAAGFFAAIATAAWFSAFAIHRAAPVRAVGQAELLFTILITIFIFRQKITRIEFAGTLLLVGSIMLVILD